MTALAREYNQADLWLLEEQACFEARESFWAFRCWMNPEMLHGWFQQLVAAELQQWYIDFISGKRPYLVLSAPPQHGKTMQVVEFVAWLAGKDPNWKAIYASFSDVLGERANRTLQRMFDNPRYQRVFPNTTIDSESVATKSRWLRNSTNLEYINQKGSFYNTTVGGQINGLGLDIGLIDDPMKGRIEAQSKAYRDKAWMWFTDDFFGRFSNHAGMIIIMTRWHVDDVVGRFIERFPRARVLVFGAIAEKDERFRKAGAALFPEHKPIDFLMERKKALAQASWESVWQQRPIVVGGGMFPIEKFDIAQHVPAKTDVTRSVRYWDKAGTKDGGAFTCGVLMHELKNGRIFISDVKRGQWAALERETRIKQTAEIDRGTWGASMQIWVEQEPGSGGKESAERTIAMLRGHIVKADKVTGAKEIRAEPYASQVQGGNVQLLGALWSTPFIEEHEAFPGGKYKDQVDSAAGAFAKLANKQHGSYDSSLSWVDS